MFNLICQIKLGYGPRPYLSFWISCRKKHLSSLIIHKKIIHNYINWSHLFNKQFLSADSTGPLLGAGVGGGGWAVWYWDWANAYCEHLLCVALGIKLETDTVERVWFLRAYILGTWLQFQFPREQSICSIQHKGSHGCFLESPRNLVKHTHAQILPAEILIQLVEGGLGISGFCFFKSLPGDGSIQAGLNPVTCWIIGGFKLSLQKILWIFKRTVFSPMGPLWHLPCEHRDYEKVWFNP